MNTVNSTIIYSGKAKTLYEADKPHHCIMEFRNDATAFNGVKHSLFEHKGEINNAFNAFIMQYLEQAGIPTHFEKKLSAQTSLVKKLSMIPAECVVRNRAAGSLCKRLGIEEGHMFNPPIFEFFYKNDKLNDPMINDSHIVTLGWATEEEIAEMKSLTLRVNEILKPLFEQAGFILADYKLEFGRYEDRLRLGDEFTLDGCRVWDIKTGEKFDKDRFRQDLGNMIEYYQEAAKRLGVSV